MNLSGLFTSIDISASGLMAQRKRMDVTASNIANINTTRTEEGGPYRRQRMVLRASQGKGTFRSIAERWKSKLITTDHRHLRSRRWEKSIGRNIGGGVEAARVVEDPAPPKLIYDPAHPDADEEGYVAVPNINIIAEMVEMIAAMRAYEANVTVMNAAKSMAKKALEI